MSVLLKVENLSYWYEDKKPVLKDLNLEFTAGLFYSIIGTSGSGKTTFLSLISGLDQAKAGMVYYQDRSIREIGLETYRNQCVSIIFQGYNLLSYLTALQNVVAAMEIKGVHVSNPKEVALRMLERVGISKEQAHQKVLTLSGGQQQRVAIARALVSESSLIIADEPTGNLDEETAEEIMTLMKDIVAKDGKTVIMVTHSKELATQTDEIFLLKNKSLIKVPKEKK